MGPLFTSPSLSVSRSITRALIQLLLQLLTRAEWVVVVISRAGCVIAFCWGIVASATAAVGATPWVTWFGLSVRSAQDERRRPGLLLTWEEEVMHQTGTQAPPLSNSQTGSLWSSRHCCRKSLSVWFLQELDNDTPDHRKSAGGTGRRSAVVTSHSM